MPEADDRPPRRHDRVALRQHALIDVAADRVHVHEAVIVDVAHEEADLIHVRHQQHSRRLRGAREPAEQVSEPVGPDVGQQAAPLAPQDLSHRAFESGGPFALVSSARSMTVAS